MTLQAIAFLIPYALSLAITTGVGMLAWGRRHSQAGARFFALYALAEASMTLGYIVELLSPTLAGKVFWDNTQFIGMFAAPIFGLLFVLRYTGRMPPRPWRLAGSLSVVPVISLVLIFTDRFHGLVRAESGRLIASEPFPALTYEVTLTFILMVVYTYVIGLGVLTLLIVDASQARHPFRLQSATLIVGLIIPYAISVLPVFGLDVGAHRDLSPIGFAIGNAVLAVGLFRYDIFDLAPIAHDTVVRSMDDGVLILDNQGRIVDVNPALREFLGQSTREVIGRYATNVFAPWRHLVEQFLDVRFMNTEITFEADGELHYGDLTLSTLRDQRGTPWGRVVVVRDITERKQVEIALQEVRDELEQRVQARTSELQQANEQLRESEARFRLLAENARDIVYRFRFLPEPGFDYVSPSAETVVGIRPQELYDNPERLLDIVHPEDRELLHALLHSRARIGDANFTLRWMKDEGSVVWTEHSRTLITDDKGDVVAEEDIARDVTERVEATEALRRAHEQLQALSRNLVEVQEAERAYIARELHDEAGQALSYQLLTLGMLERNADDPEAVATRAQEAMQTGKALMENLRRMALRLRPTALDHLGLTPALEQYVQGLSAQRNFNIQLATVGLDEERLPPEMETAFYRIIQEALTNVVRHAEATQVDVLVERRAGDVHIGDDGVSEIVAVIEDDGVGFNPTTTDTDAHLGLVGMRERVEMLGGTLTIESEPGKGTTILVEVPYGTTD